MGANIYKNKKPLFLFLVPAFAFMAIFLYYPFIQNIFNSFKQIPELGAASKGWNEPWYTNYVTMFQDCLLYTSSDNNDIRYTDCRNAKGV